MNLVEPSKLSPTLESRLLKYAFRGFRVAVPGFAPELVRVRYSLHAYIISPSP